MYMSDPTEALRVLAERALLPKIVEYGLASEDDVMNLIDHRLRDELLSAPTYISVAPLLIGQWARKVT
jgi:hypothetical protein